MNLKTFDKIAKQVADLKASKIPFDVVIRNDFDYQKGCETAYWEPAHYEVSTLKQLSEVQAIIGKPIRLNDQYNKIEIKGLKPEECVLNVHKLFESFKNKPAEKIKYPTLKFYSDIVKRYWYQFDINLISTDPSEQQEDEITYRYIGDDKVCTFCIPHTHPLYNYLDRGFFFCHINKANEKERLIIANELTLDTYLVMLLVWLQPSFAKQLTNECFINANTAKLLRVKFEKLLGENPNKKYEKQNYDRVRDESLKDYEKFANSNILQKLVDGKIPHASYNNIKLTANTATYETINIEAEGLMSTLQSYVVFDDRTDIYTIIRDYIRFIVAQLEDADVKVVYPTQPEATGDAEKDKEALDTWKKEMEAVEAKEIVYKFTINGIKIEIKRTSEHSRRTINGKKINIAELEEVAFQASCYSDQEVYDKFVKSVSKMSLKWHKALANGVPVKIIDGMSSDEYKKPEAPQAAPRIKFRKDDDTFKLVVSDTEAVPVKFNACLQKLSTLNRTTNGRWSKTGYGRRDANWARKELVKILREVTTFDVKEKIEEKSIIPVVNADGTPVFDAEGNPLLKEVTAVKVLEEKKCFLTEEQAKYIGKMAEEFQKKAIEKSKLFLATAIKTTGATKIQFQGEPGYLIEGKLRKYVVQERTNQVFNYETKAYVCIVEPGHQVSVGCDALAARLYALKNDSVLVNQIGTLRHG